MVFLQDIDFTLKTTPVAATFVIYMAAIETLLPWSLFTSILHMLTEGIIPPARIIINLDNGFIMFFIICMCVCD